MLAQHLPEEGGEELDVARQRLVLGGILHGVLLAGLGSGKVTGSILPRCTRGSQGRGAIQWNAERLAREAGLTIEFIRRHKAFRKEDRIQGLLAKRGDHPGLVHVFAAMESCSAHRPWFDKAKGQALLKPTGGKCLHYYFYFIDEDFGLCYVRVPTWAPFRLQVYFNGHAWLAQQLRAAGIDFTMADNAFLRIADPRRAQAIADTLDAHTLHQHLERWAARFCPVVEHFRGGYHWSFMQVEYATDVVFASKRSSSPSTKRSCAPPCTWCAPSTWRCSSAISSAATSRTSSATTSPPVSKAPVSAITWVPPVSSSMTRPG
jgi:hypothetical protein